MARLYSEVVCDVLDTLGFRLQAMPSTIRPLGPARRLSGRVFIARAEVVYAIAEEPYKLEIEGVERMVGGDVLVSSCGKDHAGSFWGELLTTACLAKVWSRMLSHAICGKSRNATIPFSDRVTIRPTARAG